MKLKEFVTGSLPRSKSKRKKRVEPQEFSSPPVSSTKDKNPSGPSITPKLQTDWAGRFTGYRSLVDNVNDRETVAPKTGDTRIRHITPAVNGDVKTHDFSAKHDIRNNHIAPLTNHSHRLSSDHLPVSGDLKYVSGDLRCVSGDRKCVSGDQKPHVRPPLLDSIRMNRSLVKDDFCYIEKLSPLHREDIFNFNFNVNAFDSKCACHKHITGPRSPSTRLARRVDTNYNSLPKARTRIKTNPWLPSPKGTPDSSPGSSMSTSPTSPSPKSPASKSPSPSPMEEKVFNDQANDSTVYEEIPPKVELNIGPTVFEARLGRRRAHSLASDGGSPYGGSPLQQSFSSSDSDSPMQRSFASDTDNSITANEHLYFPSCLGSVSGGLDSCTDISSCENVSAEMVEEILDEKQMQNKVSFRYEEEFESQIEAHLEVGSHDDLLSDGYGSRDDVSSDFTYCDSVFETGRVTSPDSFGRDGDSEGSYGDWDDVNDEDKDNSEKVVWELREDSSGSATDDTLCDDAEPTPREAMFIAYESPIRETLPETLPQYESNKHDDESCSIDTTDSGACSMEDSFHSGIRPPAHSRPKINKCRTKLMETDLDVDMHKQKSKQTVRKELQHDRFTGDKPADNGQRSLGDTSEGERSVGEVKSSLQEKVLRLRRDKAVVDAAVAAAREESQVQLVQKEQFQRQASEHRKVVLLRTLHDLRTKLEAQSNRLQHTYTHVLNIQKHFIFQRRTGLVKSDSFEYLQQTPV